jgi:hypothetical protein
MRAKKRIVLLVAGAITAGVLGGMAPASAGCERATLYVKAAGSTTYVLNDKCVVSTPWPESSTPLLNDEAGATGIAAVGVKFTPAKP